MFFFSNFKHPLLFPPLMSCFGQYMAQHTYAQHGTMFVGGVGFKRRGDAGVTLISCL